MSYLLELVGNGLLGELLSAFENQLPEFGCDTPAELRERRLDCPTSFDLAMRHGMACLADTHWSEAREAFGDAMELADSPVSPALGLACVCDELGQNDQTLRYLFQAHAHDPSDPAIVFAIAFCKERVGDTDAAVDYYKRAIAACPKLRNAFERLAAIALQKQDLADAVRCYQCLAEIEPDDLEILMLLANLYLEVGRPLDAIVQYERALLIEPECTEPAVSQTRSLEEKGLIDEAKQQMAEFIKKYPGIPDFHVHMGDLCVKTDDDEGAVEQYRAALDLHPQYLEATVKLGTQHLRSGRFVDAAQSFNKAVELNDRLMMAYVGLGVAQDAGGRTAEARATFDLAASLEPNSSLLFAEAARLQLKSEYGALERHQSTRTSPVGAMPSGSDLLMEQIRRHRQALALNPNHADLYYRFGLLLRQVGEFEEAVSAFRNAIEINPGYVKAIIKLGICLKEMGRADEAVEMFRRALSLRDDFVDVHYQLGLLFSQQNQFDLAVEAFERAGDGDPRNISFRANIALALQNIGMLDRAAATWRSICELSRDFDESSQDRRALLPGEG